MQLMNSRLFRKITKSAVLVGLGGIVLLFVGASTFGGNSRLPAIYYFSLFLLTFVVIGTLLPRWLQIRSALRESETNGSIPSRRRYLIWLALLFCSLPPLWLYFLRREFGATAQVNATFAYVPAVLFLAIGICLLLVSYADWLRAVRFLLKK